MLVAVLLVFFVFPCRWWCGRCCAGMFAVTVAALGMYVYLLLCVLTLLVLLYVSLVLLLMLLSMLVVVVCSLVV